jgi:hypothetical protein
MMGKRPNDLMIHCLRQTTSRFTKTRLLARQSTKKKPANGHKAIHLFAFLFKQLGSNEAHISFHTFILQKKPKAIDKLQSYYHQVLSWLPTVYKKPLPGKMAGAKLSASG